MAIWPFHSHLKFKAMLKIYESSNRINSVSRPAMHLNKLHVANNKTLIESCEISLPKATVCHICFQLR